VAQGVGPEVKLQYLKKKKKKPDSENPGMQLALLLLPCIVDFHKG
jgi:hypothetical protein